MKAIICAVVCILVLAWAGAAAAGPQIGFAEDATKYSADGGDRLFTVMNELGATTNRVTVLWNANVPATIQDEAMLDRMIPVAALHHIQVVFAIYPAKAVQSPTTQAGVDAFCNYAVEVMQRYPSVRKVIIGNEPNQPRFWRPIFNPNGSPASPAAMEAVLADCYDKLKALDPTIDVIGAGLSPRGNDDPHATSNASISPVRWIDALGKAYRASGRTAPLFDEWSWHCYPNSNTDSVETGYPWPDTGCVNAARVKLALWDAFHGTGQPVTAGYDRLLLGTGGPFDSLQLFVDEVGWQVGTKGMRGYYSAENVPTVNEATQAEDYAKLVHLADCDPTLTDFNIFHEIDETSRAGFQSGVLRADFSERPSAAAPGASLQQAILADAGSCSGGDWATLGTFLYSNTAVVPVYRTFPYESPQPYATTVATGGKLVVAMCAGEAFSYSIVFWNREGLATAAGSTRTLTATADVPDGFEGAIVTLRAETDPARVSTVELPLGDTRRR